VLPSLSRHAAEKDYESLKETFAYAMRLVFFITLPSMVGLIVLGEPMVKLLFQRGSFGAEDTQMTAYALLWYAVGLWAFSAVRVVVSTFYALSDTATPVKLATISIIANIVLAILLMWPMEHGGLALATSLASIINFLMLVFALRSRLGALGWRHICVSVLRSFVCAVSMGLAVWALSCWILPDEGTLLLNFCAVSVLIAFGSLLYFFFSFLVKSPELEYVFNILKKRQR
jgi:putative peptidoglycan lipid II flippase